MWFFGKKMEINTFVKNWTFVMGLWETAWGTMSVMTVGSFQVFIKKLTLAHALQVKVHVFPKTSIFIFSFKTINSSSEDRYGEPLFWVKAYFWGKLYFWRKLYFWGKHYPDWLITGHPTVNLARYQKIHKKCKKYMKMHENTWKMHEKH